MTIHPIAAALDLTPRYAPSHVLIVARTSRFNMDAPRETAANLPVTGTVFYPAGTHPGSVIRPEFGALELKTAHGSRWFGCTRAYINSELRMVVIGTPTQDEVRMAWPIVPERLR